MHRRRQKRVAAIEEEFNEPILDTILGLRETLTWEDVAGALGYSRAGLLRLRKALCPETIGQPRKCYKSEITPTDERAQILGYENMGDALRDLQYRQGLTNKQAAGIIGCSVSTVKVYKPDEIKGIWHWSKAGFEKLREIGRKNGGFPSPGHPWKGRVVV